MITVLSNGNGSMLETNNIHPDLDLLVIAIVSGNTVKYGAIQKVRGGGTNPFPLDGKILSIKDLVLKILNSSKTWRISFSFREDTISSGKIYRRRPLGPEERSDFHKKIVDYSANKQKFGY